MESEYSPRHAFCFDRAWRIAFLLLIVFSSFAAHALQPTAQQIQAFKQLSPDDQARLAEQYGVSLPDSSAASDQGSGLRSSQPTQSVQPRMSGFHSEKSDEAEAGSKLDGMEEIEGPVSDKLMLKPFGYELFAGNPTSFTPVTDIPVSSDYVLGPGDSLKMNLYGKESRSYDLVIDSQGQIYIPELGPISLTGETFDSARQKLRKTIDQKMIGVNASISMGQLRSIRVFVLGEAYVPGSYVVSSLSTITNALVLSGGISESGSLRNIQLKRKGELIQTLDLYDLLLSGDTSNDSRLRSGDVVFIPPVGARVGISGEVRRPALYELKESETVNDLLDYAGGLKATAYPKQSTIERIGNTGERFVEDLNLVDARGASLRVQGGDLIRVPKVLDQLDNTVELKGHVLRESTFGWKPGLRLSDVIPDSSVLKADADLRYGLIKRYRAPRRSLSVVSFSLEQVFAQKGGLVDIQLEPRDQIYVFALYGSKRQSVTQEIVEKLRAQATLGVPSKEVAVSGNVRYPGVYPLLKGMEVKDLLYAAGGLTEKAFQLQAEISRTEFDEQQNRRQERINLSLVQSADLARLLQSRDVLQIKTVPNWAESEKITLEGEVRFPGVYPIYKNDTLADVLQRAGGLTEYAYAPGAVFMRESLKQQQAEQLAEMRERLADDIAKAEIVAANQDDKAKSSDSVSEAQKLLEKLESTKAVGRLVIDLERVLETDSSYSVPLEDGDRLVVPTKKNSVTVIGEVQQSISQIYDPNLGYWDYIRRSGGTTNKADEERIYIVKANGGLVIPEESNWFASANADVHPGDTIVVPLDADKLDQIVLWRDVSQIFYQIALGAAAVGSL